MKTHVKDDLKISVDQVIDARGEPTWTDKDVEVLKTASILKVKHYYQPMNKAVKAQKTEAMKKIRLQFKEKDDLFKKIKSNEESIALTITKDISLAEHISTYLDGTERIALDSLIQEKNQQEAVPSAQERNLKKYLAALKSTSTAAKNRLREEVTSTFDPKVAIFKKIAEQEDFIIRKIVEGQPLAEAFSSCFDSAEAELWTTIVQEYKDVSPG